MTKQELDQILKRNPQLSIEKMKGSIVRSLQINHPYHGSRGCLDTVYPISDINYEDNTKSSRKVAKLECRKDHALEKAAPINEPDSRRYVVRVTSVRKRLLDEDNICEKYLVDCIRYAGIIPSDAPDKTHIITTQRKIEKGEEEHTLVEIEKI